MKNNKGTPSKETGAKNNDSNNDVDFKNNTKSDNSCKTSTSDKATKNRIK
jgi:hypothetical protein